MALATWLALASPVASDARVRDTASDTAMAPAAVVCQTRCAGPRTVAVPGRVRVTGAGLDATVAVRFSGAAGPVGTAPYKTGPGAVWAALPQGAVSGRVRLVDAGGNAVAVPGRLRVVADGAVPAPGSFDLGRHRAGPRVSFFDGVRAPTLRWRFRSDRRIGLHVQVRSRDTGRRVAGWVLPSVSPFGRHHLRWDGSTPNGPAPDGRYQFRIGRRGGYLHPAGVVVVHGHEFPVRGPHWDRGYWGQFGVPRADGRVHEGYDVMAGCGTPLVAARAGRVERRGYDPDLYGNFVQIDGRGENRDYFYAHLARPATVPFGAHVRTGQPIGVVGETGNARTVGCHLHFEIHVNGRPIDPKPDLVRWDRWS